MSPTEASKDALKRISKHYPNFKGAVVAIDKEGTHGKLTTKTINSFTIEYI